MKLSFTKTDFNNSINIVIKAVSSKTTMPILKCILIDATKDSIRLFTNDMDLAIETIVPGNVIEKGAIALDARIFSDIIRKLPDEYINISTDENLKTTISCGKAVFDIPGFDADEFPDAPDINANEEISLSQFTMKEMIRQTIFSLDMNENNKLMTGELFEIKDNVLRMVALDGHRIAIRKLELAGSYENTKVIIPGKTLSEIGKLLSDNVDEQVKIILAENHVVYEFAETKVYSRLIDGEYFHVDNMLRSDCNTKATVNKKEFQECIERASLLIRDNEGTPIILNINDITLDLSIKTSFGSMNEDINTEKSGEDIRIGFNPKYLIDALKVIDEENVTMYLLNAKAPCFIKNEEESYLYLILPINII